jgi:predicted alpha-1,2-mannosidase
VFYTALYHSLLHPNVASDVNGEYAGFDGQVHTMPAGHAEYANYSGWDIYRGQTQLESMLFPQQASDTVTSMLADHDQTGMLPKWSENNGESYVMVGDPADPIIADAYAFGARGFNAGQALTDMQTEANVQNNIRPGLNDYQTKGYLPSDGQYGCCNFYGPVSTQEEYDAADNAIAVMARALGESAVASTFATQANNWQNVFNPATGFLQPKLSDGAFRSGFDPTSANGFVEGDAYVYTAQLPFDIAGLTTAEGGDTGWIRFLDGLTSSVTAMGPAQAQMGNEPSFDIPWEYDYVGAPWKTQQVVREVEDQLYTDALGGLAGNDDLGAMSSWYVWSAIGGYPEMPGSADVAIGSPLFPNIAIHLGNGKTITETATQAADSAPYVQSLGLDGGSWDRAYLPASLFTGGGVVNWALGATPSTSWAGAPGDAPPSDIQGVLPALGSVTGPGGSTDPRIVTTPASSTTLTLGVQGMTDATQTISWAASQTAGSGLQIGPGSGSMTVGREAQATQAVQVTVPAGTPAGLYPVTFQMRSATGTALPAVVEEIAVRS